MNKIVSILIILIVTTSTITVIGEITKTSDEKILLQIRETPNKLLLKNKQIGEINVKYWIHKIDDIEIKNDYILFQTDIKDGEIIKYEKKWRDINKIPKYTTLSIEFNDIDIAWKKLVVFIEKNDLNNFYSIDSNQEFPLLCWEIRYKNGKTSLINISGQKIGQGIPAPLEYKGFSLSGYCQDSSPDCWNSWRQNANFWFNKWCISTKSISLPTPNTISSYVSNPEYYLFYELAHGASTYFQADSPGVYYYASDVEQDMSLRDKMIFSFIGSCEGMTNTGDGTFSYEFRKGSLEDTVTVGYSGMGTCPGWSVSLQWQDFMFYAMNSNNTIKNAFNLACAEYPTISDCVVFVGDASLKIVEDKQDDDDDYILPNVFITYPTEASIVNGSIKITGIADDLDGVVKTVYVQIDNENWQEAYGTNSWELTWDTTTVTDGLHKITAVAIDNNGLQSGCQYVNVYVVNTCLETSIIAPDQALINQEIIFRSSTNGGIPPYNFTWDFGDGTISYNQDSSHMYNKPGKYDISLNITDCISNTVSDTKEILIIETDTTSPVIEIIKPEHALYLGNNKLFSLPFIFVIGDITIEVKISDQGGSGLEKVEFYLDDNLKETFNNSSNIYQWIWDTVAFFEHTITIKAYDYAENIKSMNIEIFKLG